MTAADTARALGVSNKSGHPGGASAVRCISPLAQRSRSRMVHVG